MSLRRTDRTGTLRGAKPKKAGHEVQRGAEEEAACVCKPDPSTGRKLVIPVPTERRSARDSATDGEYARFIASTPSPLPAHRSQTVQQKGIA